jgi:hypothetical protein
MSSCMNSKSTLKGKFNKMIGTFIRSLEVLKHAKSVGNTQHEIYDDQIYLHVTNQECK